MSKVTDHLYTGGAAALNPSTIADSDISCIINVTNEIPNLRMTGVISMKLWLEDTLDTDLRPYFDMVADQIQEVADREGRTLVHCLAGVSRSASFCLAYLIKYEKKSLREAYDYLQARRPMVRPNVSFWKQLVEYELELRGVNSVKILKLPSGDFPDVYVTEGDEEEEELDDRISLASSSGRSFSEDSECSSDYFV